MPLWRQPRTAEGNPGTPRTRDSWTGEPMAKGDAVSPTPAATGITTVPVADRVTALADPATASSAVPAAIAPTSAVCEGQSAQSSPMLSPLLRESLAALDAAGVEWCLLRGGAADIAQGARDTDLLVAPADWARLDVLLGRLGFLHVPGHGLGRMAFFVGRDRDTGSWVHLDATADISFGPFSALETGLASGCLRRLRRTDGIPGLSPDDMFWALLLHCVVEKGSVAQRHRARLEALVDQGRDDGPMGTFVGSLVPFGWDPRRLRAAVRAGDWADLVALRSAIRLRLWRRDALRATGRIFGRAIERTVGFGRLLRRRWGLSVALLGPDGAGKTTLAAAIAADFGLPVRTIYMGMWSSPQRGLTGRIPGLAIVARPVAAACKALVAEYHRARGRLVIFDRYTHDALIPPRGPLVFLKRVYFWVLAHAAPTPQLVVVLDAPGYVLYARKGEFDPDRLEADRRAFRALNKRLGGVRIIDASRSPEVVKAEVTDLIWTRYLHGSLAGTRP